MSARFLGGDARVRASGESSEQGIHLEPLEAEDFPIVRSSIRSIRRQTVGLRSEEEAP